jgi:D-tyrosyl-tRNA(Tyr) deacylase
VRAVVQRVAQAAVEIEGRLVSEIGPGLLVLVGISPEDAEAEIGWLADKLIGLRIFEDADGKMNRSLEDTGGEVLLVSQFTLYGDARKGRRPSFVKAARGAEAERLYEAVAARLATGGVRCSTGVFGAMMRVSLVNDGPVTILLDSDKTF